MSPPPTPALRGAERRPVLAVALLQRVEGAFGKIPQTGSYKEVYAMDKELLFITVIGEDKKGIVAKISMLLYECNINIEDINQKIMDNYFVMIMLVDMKGAKHSLEKVREELEKIGDELRVKIQIQHENIFKMMHRV